MAQVAQALVTPAVGKEEEKDWCAPAQQRVKDGSDGLWVRCGPDEDEESCKAACFSIRFNPCVSCGATVLLFGIVFFCILWTPGNYCWGQSKADDGTTLLVQETCYVPGILFSDWQSWVTEAFTWLYIGTQDAWIIFIVVVYFSKYGDMKLGKEDDVPEFSQFQWFAMVFSCGVGTGLFYFGVAEPVWHYTGDNRWKDLPQNKKAQEAINTTLYHWGLHGWVCYAILGVLLAILHFRKGLPMTIKSCFYPLLGMNIYGFWGDLLDTVSVVATTMGVCTSLGLGVIQLNTGMERLIGFEHWLGLPYYNSNNYADWKDRDLQSTYNAWPNHVKAQYPWKLPDGSVSVATAGHVADVIAENNQQILLIWLITGMATCSVLLGLKTGIATLATICLWLGMFLMVFVLLMDDTYFLLNLFVQSLGFYVQWLWEIGWHTGAFSQSEHNDPHGESQGWMDGWTIFYWGWWIAWAPFVGVFLARIGKGRTVREFINGTIFIPVLYNFAWMIIFGGAGLKMQILAETHGIKCNMNLDTNGERIPGLAPYSRNVCRNVATNEFTTEGVLFCSTVSNLSCTSSANMLFDLLMQYGDLGYLLCVIAMLSLVLYFVTSSDSGSMVDDIMTANGIPEPPLLQRLYWAITEGLAATALLYAGRFLGTETSGLKALQAASICVGLPYTFLICFMCLSLWRTFQYEFKDRQWHDGFKYSVVDVGVTFYTALPGKDLCCNWGAPECSNKRLGKLVKNIFLPCMGFWPTARGLETRIKSKKDGSVCAAGMLTVAAMVFFYGAILFWFLDFIPASGNPLFFGSEKGSTPPYYVSSRYGYYRAWKDIPSGVESINICNLTQGLSFSEANNEVPFDGGNGCAPQGVGERIGGNGAFWTISCFLFFGFVMCVTFLRFDVREHCGVPGSIIEDFFLALIWPSTLFQCEKQVEETAGDSDSDEERASQSQYDSDYEE